MNFRQLRTGQKFLIVAGVVIICLLVIFGVKANQRTGKDSNTSTSNSTTNSNNTAQYFRISEWHVRAPKNPTLDLQYTILPDPDNPSRYAQFSSKQLEGIDPACANHGGAIQRFETDERVPGQNLPAKIYFETQPKSSFTYINRFYYTYVPPLLDCSKSEVANRVQLQNEAAVESIVTHLEYDANN
jgi:hypothetical protein